MGNEDGVKVRLFSSGAAACRWILADGEAATLRAISFPPQAKSDPGSEFAVSKTF